MLEFRQVTKHYPKSSFTLQNITCTLGPGLHVLAGPNGSGKTTLLRMAAGILRPDSGSLLYAEQDIAANISRYKKRLGYMPQTFAFYSHMTGMDFLLYLANLKGLFGRSATKRACFAADLLGIQQHCHKKINTWSMGLRQRLGIAQALLNDPDIVILDEPLCSLAFEESIEVKNLLSQLAKSKVILLSSHLLNDLPISKLLLVVKGSLHFAGLPSIFTDQAKGHVWTVTTGKSALLSLQQAYPESSSAFTEEGCQLRIISTIKPDLPHIKEVTPTLEEAYLIWLKQLTK
jgi:ABC-type multidrug transport system ATPase subunit